MTKITNGRYSYKHLGVGFYVRQREPGCWLLDIGKDDIWEPAGATRKEAIAYAQRVIEKEGTQDQEDL